jgi:hypothetical protein
MGMNERVVKASVVSSGLNGGELLLTDWADLVNANNKSVSAFDQLRSGQWIMLCGPHPNSSNSEPRLALNWYQVLAIDNPVNGVPGYDQTKSQRVVTLRGPQWPWQPPLTYNSAEPSNNLCVGIFRGAVAVHSKTMRLEGHGSSFSVSAGGASATPVTGPGGAGTSGDSGFGTSGSPSSTPPNNTYY